MNSKQKKFIHKNGSRITVRWLSILVALTIQADSAELSDPNVVTTVLHFVEVKPSELFVREVAKAFSTAQYLRFKYADAGAIEGSINRLTITSKWEYAVTMNCNGSCAKVPSAIGERIKGARRVDRECPPPYDMALELMSKNGNVIETFSFGVGGMCFSYRGEYFAISIDQPVGRGLSSVPINDIFSFQ
jgi:hypothetical protein